MTTTSFANTVSNVTTLIIGVAFFAVTAVGIAAPAKAFTPAATTQTVAR